MIPLLLHALGFDYDEVLMLCTALAAGAAVVVGYRRESRLDALAVDHAERIARLEANSDDSVALEARLVHLEAAAARDERFDDRLVAYAERIAVLETKLAAYEAADGEDE